MKIPAKRFHADCLSLFVVLSLNLPLMADEPSTLPLKVPEGFGVEVAAPPSMVAHPLMADFDDRGRLYVAASAGENLQRADLESRLPNFIQRLEDLDGDGVFDKATVFADRMTFPQGCLWLNGSLYVASSGAIWKLTDADDDGVAEERIKLVGDFGYTGNAADIHGPFEGPDGRIYWCDGRHGHDIKDAAGNPISRGKAASIFSCNPDGSDVQIFCTGGMDNPVEVLFLPRGEMLGTVNLMYSRPRGDCLVHWQYGGVYPREDFVESLDGEFVRTGPLLPEVHNFGHVAVSGLCRLQPTEGSDSARETILVTEFNTNRLAQLSLRKQGSRLVTEEVKDFAVSESTDFHPTDVLQDADGSLLLIDTGGWFRIGCPQSQVEKSHLHGAIYRIRPAAGKTIANPRGNELSWNKLSESDWLCRLGDARPAVRQRAIEVISSQLSSDWNGSAANSFSKSIAGKSAQLKQAWIGVLIRVGNADALKLLTAYTGDEDPDVRQTAIRSLLYVSPRLVEENETLFHSLLAEIQNGSPASSYAALATAGRLFSSRPGFVTELVKAVKINPGDVQWRHALVFALIASNDREALNTALFSADETIRLGAADAMSELRRPRPDRSTQVWLEVPAAGTGQPLDEAARERLQQLATSLQEGNASAGKVIFASEKTNCVKCHRIGQEGGMIGPDLSTIGKSRSHLDLLEAVLYPSSSFARGFAPYVVADTEGRVVSGIILSESSTHLRMGLSIEQSVSIPIAEIDEIKAADTSIMPSDVARQLSPQELADLIAYLKTLK
ncbi:DUF7133 domain-containing protein [Planctomicrobium sp. SH661]|uniref:DUF7133 domain-containing protein n=1 Tax=Planctomicrobium sp. SH661 TaxID=3448124 RepID=UPI003F5AE1C3